MFVRRGFGAWPAEVEETLPETTRTPVPAPLLKPPPPPIANVPKPEESRVAQRIYDLHQKRKISRGKGLETDAERRRFQEYAKFLMAYVSTYAAPNGRLRPDVAYNLLRVVRETPGMMPGISFAPAVVVFGVVLRVLAWGAGFLFGKDVLAKIGTWLGIDEKREEARLKLIDQGRSADEIKKIMDSGGADQPPGPGLLGNIGNIMQYALWGAVAYFGYKFFLEKKFNRPRRRRRA